MNNYDVVLCKESVTGLSPATIRAMLSYFAEDIDLLPVDITDDNDRMLAVGFINSEVYEALDDDLRPLRHYIAGILEDADKETDDGVYETTLKSWYSSSVPDVPVRILMRYGYR